MSGGSTLSDGVVSATEVVSGVTLLSGAVLGPLPGAAPPVIAAPADASVDQGVATAVGGIVLTETGAVSGETFTVTATDASGILAAGGAGVTGDGTTSLTISGSLTQVNSDLAGLTVTEAGTASDTLDVSATDSFGHSGAPAATTLTVVPAGPLPPVYEELDGPGVMTGSGLAYALNLGTFLQGSVRSWPISACSTRR